LIDDGCMILLDLGLYVHDFQGHTFVKVLSMIYLRYPFHVQLLLHHKDIFVDC